MPALLKLIGAKVVGNSWPFYLPCKDIHTTLDSSSER